MYIYIYIMHIYIYVFKMWQHGVSFPRWGGPAGAGAGRSRAGQARRGA